MISRLFGRRREQRVSSVPLNCVVWAVGDIHGRADLADRLIQVIRVDLARSGVERRVVVFLGDYVDRGPGSKAVLDQVVNLMEDLTLEVRCLQGNHDERMLAFLDDPALGPAWCDYGGRETLASYGVNPPAMRTDREGWAETSASFADALPATHRALLAGLQVSASIGDYFFCHAGARPGVPLADQSVDDLLWIREPFLSHPAQFEQIVVHGHTPTEAVVSDDRRIGLDTGAYATNVLSAVRLEGSQRVVLQASGRGSAVSVVTTPLPS